MLGYCEEHGYYRGKSCPVCNKEGKFIMNDYETKKLSSILVGILRHFPKQFNVELDKHGWGDMEEIAQLIIYCAYFCFNSEVRDMWMNKLTFKLKYKANSSKTSKIRFTKRTHKFGVFFNFVAVT